ncbi:MAG: dihydrofolate reductase [Anaerolineae bacterium]|nr:dihydrofolate reductase [Anaerolineae bacterium]MCA9895476.1 dihydrofolate reductase [Anaerolineae bacterium]
MRKLVITEFMSLDGVIENPAWTFPYWNDDIAAFKGEESESTDALLLGRVTYEGFAAAWPTSEDEGAEYFNGVRKYVVSTTLKNADWNNSVIISDNVVEEIAKLKEQDGKDITVHGSGKLAQSLLENGLVDRVRLLIYPVVLGQGQKLFVDGMTATFKLVETKPMGDGGVVAMIYEPIQE